MPGAVVPSAARVGTIVLQLPADAATLDIKKRLKDEGLGWKQLMSRSWAVDDERGHGGLEAARLLHRGMPLRPDMPLQVQGVLDGEAVLLVRSSVGPTTLRSKSGHEPSAPRGFLITPGAPPWQEKGPRKVAPRRASLGDCEGYV